LSSRELTGPPLALAPFARVMGAVCETIDAHADELTELDRVIGDADHGLNMKRGFAAIEARMDALSAMPLSAAITESGKTLVMTVGGASGPLFGTLLMRFGTELGSGPLAQATAGVSPAPLPTRSQLARALQVALDAVKARGKAVRGQKTMIDVLEPVAQLLASSEPVTPAQISACASAAAQATVPMKAERGRASFLGERSVGHLDPGARSTELIIKAIVEVIEGE